MKIDYAKIDDVNGEITVTLEEKDYADKVEKELKKISKTHAEPGFRPGHVPAGILKKKYGTSVKYDVINNEVGNALFEYIKENKIHVLGNPVPESNDFDVNAADYILKFKVGVAPEFETHVNKDLHVPYYTIKVSNDMIERQDEQYTRRLGKQESGDTVDATAVVKGVITELNEDGSVKEDGIVVENGIVSPQYFKDEAQKEAFMGKHVGDTVKFNPAATCDSNAVEMASMLNIDKDATENHKGDFNFEIKDIIVLKPAEHNEEFYKNVCGPDVKDEAAYRDALKQQIAAQLSNDSNFRFTIDAKNAIMSAIGDIELPDAILKDFLKRQNNNLTEENIDEEYTRLLPELRWELEKDAVAEQLEISINDDDLLNVARMLARQQFAQYGMTNIPDEAVDKYAADIVKDQKAHEQLYAQAFDMKFYNGVRASVTVDEKDVDVEQFNDLFRQEMAAK